MTDEQFKFVQSLVEDGEIIQKEIVRLENALHRVRNGCTVSLAIGCRPDFYLDNDDAFILMVETAIKNEIAALRKDFEALEVPQWNTKS